MIVIIAELCGSNVDPERLWFLFTGSGFVLLGLSVVLTHKLRVITCELSEALGTGALGTSLRLSETLTGEDGSTRMTEPLNVKRGGSQSSLPTSRFFSLGRVDRHRTLFWWDSPLFTRRCIQTLLMLHTIYIAMYISFYVGVLSDLDLAWMLHTLTLLPSVLSLALVPPQVVPSFTIAISVGEYTRREVIKDVCAKVERKRLDAADDEDDE